MLLPKVTFIEQSQPIDEYGRALYAIARSILRALIDSLSDQDLTDINTPIADVRLRQLAKICRIDLDKGMRGDGFEWAVHEAIQGQESLIIDPLADAMRRASKHIAKTNPNSLLFGYERAKYLGFLDAVVDAAGTDAFLLPEGSGRPFKFGPWVSAAANGQIAENMLPARIKKILKTDLFLYSEGDPRHLAATVKSNFNLLEGGKGLRIGIVPESTDPRNPRGVRYDPRLGLWVVTLADPNGFMGLFNDGYHAMARVICHLGKQPAPPYYIKPSVPAQKLQEQLEKFADAKVLEIEDALDAAAQQDLVASTVRLVGVNAPNWLHIKQMAPKVISPKPSFYKLDGSKNLAELAVF